MCILQQLYRVIKVGVILLVSRIVCLPIKKIYPRISVVELLFHELFVRRFGGVFDIFCIFNSLCFHIFFTIGLCE